MPEPLAGKAIVVTGAGRGLGRAIAAACVEAGALVGAGYVTSEAAVRALAVDAPGRVVPLPLDVRDAASVAAAVSAFRAAAGRIDGWVNNAAVNLADLAVSLDVERARQQIEVNLLGPLLCARAVLPVMLEQRAGVILNVSSVAAVRPARGQAVYAATKGGVESLTRALATEYGRKGIRVQCLRPGPVDTEMLAPATALLGDDLATRLPVLRLGRPQDVATFAVFLLSDAAAFVTGSVHTVDGGYLAAW